LGGVLVMKPPKSSDHLQACAIGPSVEPRSVELSCYVAF
jgi:hypothetical protein